MGLFFQLFAKNCIKMKELDFQGSHSDWKTGKNGKAFSSQWEKSGEMHTKYWKILGIFRTNSYFLLLLWDFINESCVLFAKIDQVTQLRKQNI